MADTIVLDRKTYTLAHESLVPRGARRWAWSKRPSQQGDPSVAQVAEWRLDGSQLHSYEEQGEGYLGVDWCEGTDSRWADIHTLGPEITVIELDTYDGQTAPANANGCALVTAGGVSYLYVIRGKVPAKIAAGDLSLKDCGVTLAEAATSVLATRAGNGDVEISFGMDGTDYHVITAIGTPPAADTAGANAGGVKRRIFGIAPDRIVGTGGSGNPQTVSGNIMTGAIDMASPNWNDVSTLDGPQLTMTGFAVDGNQWIIGTNRGPYLLDAGSGKFFPMIPELAGMPDLANCRNMRPWSFQGVIIPLRTGTRWHRLETGRSFGLRSFKRNTSPVQGYTTAVAVSEHCIWTAEWNEVERQTYIVQWQQPGEGDGYGDRELIPFVIGVFESGVRCEFMEYVGTLDGQRTNPVLIGGHDADLFAMVIGRNAREVDDANYRFAVDGKTYLTELRRYPHMVKDLEAVEIETIGCSEEKTVTVGFAVDGGGTEWLAGKMRDTVGNVVNGAAVTDGYQRLVFVDDSGRPLSWASGRRVKPVIWLASNTNTASPQVQGVLRLSYRLRPLMTEALRFSVQIDGSGVEGVKSVQKALADQWGRGPVEMGRDIDGQRYFVRVESVSVSEEGANGVRVASVEALRWPGM